MSDARERPAAVRGGSVAWWGASILGPVSVVVALVRRRVVNREVMLRLEEIERRLATVEAALAHAPGREPVPAAKPEPARSVALAPPPRPRAPVTTSSSKPPPPPTGRPYRAPAPKPMEPPREIDWGALFGPKALAVSGAVVTVLGIVFFFALAVNRGWIGPEARVALGTAASLLVFGAGLVARQRYGALHASVAAVGAGIAGGYATLLAATALYDLVPETAALLFAAAIAGMALVVSLAWRDELVAGIGLIGAMVAPALLVIDTGLTAVGTAFVALVLASSATVAVALRWRHLLAVSAIIAVPQVLVLFADRARPDASLLILAAAFCGIYLAAGIAWQLRGRPDTLDGTATTFVMGSAALAFYSAFALFSDSSRSARGADLLAYGAAYGALGAFFLVRRSGRDLGSLLAALALALAAVGVADVFSGGSLTYVWAAETAVLAWLARRMHELRFQLAALAYGALALVHALAFEAPLSHVFDPIEHPAAGVSSLLAVAAGLAVVALPATGAWRELRFDGVLVHLNGFFAGLRSNQRTIRIGAVGFAVLLTIEAASLVLLEAYSRWWPGDLQSAYEHGHVALTGAWTAAA